MLAFDIGSHTGTFSDYLHTEGYNSIIAVDPLDINQSSHNIYIKGVVSDVEGVVNLHLNTNTAISSINQDFINKSRFATSPHYAPHASFGEVVQVPAITYEQLVAQYGVPQLVKLDVEGHELPIIKSMQHMPKVIGFEWHQELTENTLQILTILQSKGFDQFVLQEFTHKQEYELIPEKYHTINQLLTTINHTDPKQKPWNLRWGMVWATSAH